MRCPKCEGFIKKYPIRLENCKKCAALLEIQKDRVVVIVSHGKGGEGHKSSKTR